MLLKKGKIKMNKKVKYIFIGLGLILIILGLSLLLMTGKESNNTLNGNGIEIDISQSDMSGDKISNTKYQVFESYTETSETYINSNDMLQKNIYTFKYPAFLMDAKLDDKSKYLFSDNLTIEAYTDNYGNIENCKKKLIEPHDNENTLLQIYEHKEKVNISGFDTYYFKLNYQEETINADGKKQTNYKEKFVILINESNDSIIVFTITATDFKLSNKALTEFINNIKVDKEVATYTYGLIDDVAVRGSIKQKKIFSSQIYTIKYELPSNDYEEKSFVKNNIYKTRFDSRNIDAFIDIEIHVDIYESPEFLDKYTDEIKSSNSDNNPTNFESKTVTYNGINYHQISFDYDDLTDKVTRKKLYLIRELEKDVYYIVAFTSKDDVTENMINDFLNVKYEIEYPEQENQE